MPLKGCLRDAQQHFFNCPLAKNSIVILDGSQYHQPWIHAQRFSGDVEVWPPREVYSGRTAQIALATRRGTSIAGPIVHQIGTTAAMLSSAQVAVLKHLVQPLLDAFIATGETLIDRMQVPPVGDLLLKP